MSKVPVIDTDSGKPAGAIDIPDDVLRAAAVVHDWLSSRGEITRRTLILNGLRLADDV